MEDTSILWHLEWEWKEPRIWSYVWNCLGHATWQTEFCGYSTELRLLQQCRGYEIWRQTC
jgi:hypothetical protein